MGSTPINTWNGDVARLQIDNAPFFDGSRQFIARKFKLETYRQFCDVHGVSDFDTKSGACRVCATSNPHRSRADARRLGFRTYLATCAEHGETDHDVPRGRCLKCFTTAGAPRTAVGSALGRPVTNGARAVARREGEKTYLATCQAHGAAAHSVTHGKCLSCFNTAGLRRPLTPP